MTTTTMGIYVPSMGRANAIAGGVLRSASPELKKRIHFVVPDDEVTEYRNRCSVHEPKPSVIGCPAVGIAKTRLWIGQRAAQVGFDKFLMLDDDVQFFNRISTDSTKLEKANHASVNTMLATVENALDQYAHVGISAREGNNRFGVGDLDLRVENTRTLRCLAYQTKAFLAMEHGRVEVMEDFDVNLQLLESGTQNCNIAFWAQDQRMTNAPGGCSTYRSHAVHEASARKLAELHPGLVRLTEKKNKTDAAGFGTRTEVVISWKKAYAQGVAA